LSLQLIRLYFPILTPQEKKLNEIQINKKNSSGANMCVAES